MPKEEWIEWNGQSQLPPRLGPQEYKEDVCPGFLVRLPLVCEVAGAWKAFDKGNWDSFYSADSPNCLHEGVQILDNALTTHRNWLMEQRDLAAQKDSK